MKVKQIERQGSVSHAWRRRKEKRWREKAGVRKRKKERREEKEARCRVAL